MAINKLPIISLLLAGAISCSAEAADVVQKKTVEQTVRLEKGGGATILPVAKLSEIVDSDVAQLLFDNASIKVHPNDVEAGISKWSAPLRVSIQDGKGKDLDLSTFPGADIKKHLIDFAVFTGIPLTIAPVANHNNNVSIVMRKKYSSLKSAPEVGQIMGVPELGDEKTDDLPFNKTRFWKTGTASQATEGFPDGHEAGARIGYDIKACILFIEADPGPKRLPLLYQKSIIQVLTDELNNCLGLNYHENKRNGAESLIERHSQEFLRLLYSHDIKSGMTASTAKPIIEKLASQAE